MYSLPGTPFEVRDARMLRPFFPEKLLMVNR